MWWKRSSPWQRFRCAGFGCTPVTETIRTHGSVALALFAWGSCPIHMQMVCATSGGDGWAGAGCRSAGYIPSQTCSILTAMQCRQSEPHRYVWYRISSY